MIVLQDVAVLGEAELMAVMVMSKRKFQLIHGGVVRTADVLGERKGIHVRLLQHAVLLQIVKNVGTRRRKGRQF